MLFKKRYQTVTGSPGISNFWANAFGIYILGEALYQVIYYLNTFFSNCDNCLLPPFHYVAMCLLNICSTALVWSILYRLTGRKLMYTLTLNVGIFLVHQVIWFFILYGIVKAEALYWNRDVLFSGYPFKDAVYDQAYHTWYDSAKYLMKVVIFYSLKYYEDYKSSEKKKEELLLMNKQLQLGLLKQQVNPHFYFNTLNNLYGLARNGSPMLYPAVRQLSAIMQYVLNECNNEMVLLQKEIIFLKSYIALEKLRYEKETVIELQVEGDAGNNKIPSLLLIQFIENAFKHGMKEKTEKSWMKACLTIKDKLLSFVLQNSCHYSILPEGIGLGSSRRRLDLLYKNRYRLLTGVSGDVFTVNLQIQLT